MKKQILTINPETYVSQTGIMLLDNIAAVSRAVQWMAQQDEPPHSATPVSPSAAGTGAAGSQFDSPSDRRICTSSTTSTALVRNYPAKLPPPADLQERLIDFTAEDDFFAAETTSAAGAGKKNDKAAAAVAGKWVWDGSDYVWKAGDEPHFHSTSHLHLHSPPLPLEKPSAKKIAPVGRAHPSTARSLDGAVQLSQQPPTHSPATPVLTPAPASALVGVRAKVGDLLGRPPQPVNALVKEKKPTNSCAEPARTSDRLPAIYSWAQTLQNKPKVVVSVMATKPASSRPQVPYFPAPPRPTVPVLKKATHQPSPVKVSASVPQNPERTADPVESGGWRGKRKLSGVVVNGMKK